MSLFQVRYQVMYLGRLDHYNRTVHKVVIEAKDMMEVIDKITTAVASRDYCSPLYLEVSRMEDYVLWK